MPPKSREETRKAREEVQANIERIKALRTEGNEEAAQELDEATRTLLPSLSTTAKREMTKALNAASSQRLLRREESDATFSTVDWRSAIDDPDAVLSSASDTLTEIIGAETEVSDKYLSMAKFMFEQYRQLSYNGEPDVMANSQASRDISSETQSAVRASLTRNRGLSDEDARADVDSAWVKVKRRLSDYRASYIAELDDDPKRFRELYPGAAEKYPNHRPSEAMSLHFGIDPLGFSVRNNRSMKIRRLRKRAEELPEGAERNALLGEIRELEQSLGIAPSAVDPVKITDRVVNKVGKAVQGYDPHTVSRLSLEQRQKIVKELSPPLATLQAVLSAALTGYVESEEEPPEED